MVVEFTAALEFTFSSQLHIGFFGLNLVDYKLTPKNRTRKFGMIQRRRFKVAKKTKRHIAACSTASQLLQVNFFLATDLEQSCDKGNKNSVFSPEKTISWFKTG